MGALEARVGAFEQNVNTRFGTLETRMEAQDKKLDQILLSLAVFTEKPDQKA